MRLTVSCCSRWSVKMKNFSPKMAMSFKICHMNLKEIKPTNKRRHWWLSLILFLLLLLAFICWLYIALLISLTNYLYTFSSWCLSFPKVCMCKCHCLYLLSKSQSLHLLLLVILWSSPALGTAFGRPRSFFLLHSSSMAFITSTSNSILSSIVVVVPY